jgi:inorganic pyrophosphatase
MAYQDVTPGKDVPNEVNVIIEIQKGGGMNKYEFNKDTGRLTLDRVNGTTARYPADYGYN